MLRRQFVTHAPRLVAALAAPALVRNVFAQEGGISSKSLTIGCSASLTGPLAGFGRDIKQGAEAALAQINARGGIHGRKIRYIVEDNQYQVPRSIQAANKLINRDNVFLMIANGGTVSQDTNVLITMDLTGSISSSELAASVSALKSLITAYDGLGDVNVQLTTFKNGTAQPSSAWLSKTEFEGLGSTEITIK